MLNDYKQIIKGFYQYPQINSFLTVKNYMFLIESNRKSLLLRFSNDADYYVNSISLTVIQIDHDGKTIKRTPVSFDRLNVAPGSLFAPEKAVVVESNCVDFKISFDCVVSGNYKYTVVNNKAVAHFIKPEKALVDESAPYGNISTELTVRAKKRKISSLAVFASCITLAMMVIVNVFHMYWAYLDKAAEDERGKNNGIVVDTLVGEMTQIHTPVTENVRYEVDTIAGVYTDMADAPKEEFATQAIPSESADYTYKDALTTPSDANDE